MKNSLPKSMIATTLLGFQLLGPAVQAQTPTNTMADSQIQSSITQVDQGEKPKKGLNVGLAVEYSQNVAIDELGERGNSVDLTLAPIYNINDRFAIGAKGGFSKANEGKQEITAANTQVILGITGVKINENLKTLHSVSAIAPTSEVAQKTDRLQAAIGVSNGLALATPWVTAEYKLGLSKNFHEFTINADGKANVEYSLSNALEIKLIITDKLYLSGLGIYRMGRTYRGFERQTFEAHGDINYDVTEKFGMNLGTSNKGSAFKANGADSNLSAYDEDTSIVRAGISLVL